MYPTQQNININKVQGDVLEAICETGTITTQSCYVEQSKFIAIQGHLHLKNVHKYSQMFLPDGGSMNVTGFHGRLSSRSYGGDISFQFTELYGESLIQADVPESFTVNISEFVEENTCIHATAKVDLTLDDTLAHLSEKINMSGDFQIGNSDLCDDQLRIVTSGSLRIGKLSWLDTLQFRK